MGVPGWMYGILFILIILMIVGVIIPFFLNINLFAITPWILPIVALLGALIFLGIVSAFYLNNHELAKMFFNISIIVTFFATLGLEMVLFGMYIHKVSTIPYEKCEKEESPIHIASCILTGYKVSSEFASWEWASFWIFFILLPFAFVFSFLYGLLAPVKLFPTPAMLVMNFVISAYATRQIFGVFLLDLAAYGVWGVVGVFIPLFLSLILKRGFDILLGPIEAAQQTLYGQIAAHYYARISEIEERVKNIEIALKNINITLGALNSMSKELEGIKEILKGLESAIKSEKALSSQEKAILLEIIMKLVSRSDACGKEIGNRIKHKGYRGGWVFGS